MSIEFHFHKIKSSGHWLHNPIIVFNTAEFYTLKWLYMCVMNAYLCIHLETTGRHQMSCSMVHHLIPLRQGLPLNLLLA